MIVSRLFLHEKSDRKNTHSKMSISYYTYNPTLVGGITFVVLFGLLIVWQTYQSVASFILIGSYRRSHKDVESSNYIQNPFEIDRKKIVSTRYVWILIPFYIGLFCEFVGYIARVMAHDNITDRTTYIVQTLLILVGPPFFSASIYMVFGKIVTRVLHNEDFLLIRARFITKICVIGDVISLFLQAIGGIVVSGAEDDEDRFNLGKNIILFGLAVQIIFFGFFFVIELSYYIRLLRNLNSSEYNTRVVNQDIRRFPNRFNNWKTILEVLFSCSGFILIRSAYRVVEFTQSSGGYISTHEWVLYVFDGLMMLFNALLFVSQDLSNYFLKTVPLTLEKI